MRWWLFGGPEICDCGHRKGDHKRNGLGPRKDLDSYSIECECPSSEDNDKD